jgi:hypothetical protein
MTTPASASGKNRYFWRRAGCTKELIRAALGGDGVGLSAIEGSLIIERKLVS